MPNEQLEQLTEPTAERTHRANVAALLARYHQTWYVLGGLRCVHVADLAWALGGLSGAWASLDARRDVLRLLVTWPEGLSRAEAELAHERLLRRLDGRGIQVTSTNWAEREPAPSPAR